MYLSWQLNSDFYSIPFGCIHNVQCTFFHLVSVEIGERPSKLAFSPCLDSTSPFKEAVDGVELLDVARGEEWIYALESKLPKADT